MAFPVVEGTATTAGKSTSLSVNLPASIASGDLLVAVVTVRDNATSMTFPAGWTEVLDDIDGSPQRVGGGLGYRVADGTEGSTFTLTFPTDKDTVVIVYRISGTAETAPEYTVATGNSSTPDPGSLTPSWGSDDTLWIAACCVDGRFPTADPTSYTDGVQNNNNNCYTRGVERDNATATENPSSFSLADTEEWWCLTVGIEPAAGGTNTNVNLDAGSYTLSGKALGIAIATGVALAAGSYTFTGRDIDISTVSDTAVALDAGSYSLTGNALTVALGRAVNLDAGGYTLTGNALTVTTALQVALDAGSYTFTGNTLDVVSGAGVALDAGSYTFSGHALDVALGRAVGLDAGSYSLTGNAITVTLSGVSVNLDAGNYTLTGNALSVLTGLGVALDANPYVFTGYNLGVVVETPDVRNYEDIIAPPGTPLFKAQLIDALDYLDDAIEGITPASLGLGTGDTATFGSLGIGTTAPDGTLNITGSNFDVINADRVGNNTGASNIALRKARGSLGSEAAINASDNIGSLNFTAHDGTSYDAIGVIKVAATAISAGNVRGEMTFQTSDSGGSLADRAVLDDTGLDVAGRVKSETLDLVDAVTRPILNIDHIHATPAVDQEIGRVGFRGGNSAAETPAYVQLRSYIGSPTDGSERGYLTVYTNVDGTPAEHFRITEDAAIGTGYVKTGSTTVASLPSPSTAGAGARHFVTDANATTFLSTVAGGGSNKVPVVSDGTNWLIG